jgi:hypothetical protein
MDETWTEARLQRMLEDKVPESASLDYKRSAALVKTDRAKAEISKDVSSFANAGGGVLIYGIAENDHHEPQSIDEGADPQSITKEWLEDVITSTIHRKIEGITIECIELRQTRPGKIAYVVTIPQSLRAPHMAVDYRYYKRHNFKSQPMEEYEVRDVSLRAMAPQLTIYFYASDGVQPPMEERSLRFNLSLFNQSREPATAASITLYVDARLVVDRGRRGSGSVYGEPPRVLPVAHFSYAWGGPNAFPIFAGATPAQVAQIQFEALDRSNGGPYVIWWSIATPHALETTGVTVLHWVGEHLIDWNNLTDVELAARKDIAWCASIDEANGRFAALNAAHAKRRL